MANKPLQSIKFPDLPDTYTIPVVDSTLAVSGAAADAKQTGDSLADKVDKVSGKGLSTNDYTDEEKTKLAGVETGANKTVIDTTLTQTGQPADAKVVGDKISDLKEDLKVTKLFDILNKDILVEQGSVTLEPDYINNTVTAATGEIGSASSKRITNKSLIYVPEGATLNISVSSTSTYYNPTRYCFDKNGDFLEEKGSSTTSLASGTYYVRVLLARKDNRDITTADAKSDLTITLTKTTPYDAIAEQKVLTKKMIYGGTLYTSGKKINASRQIVDATGYCVTDFFEVTGGTAITIYCNASSSDTLYGLEYDKDKNIIDRWGFSAENRTFNLTANARYFQFTFTSGYSAKATQNNEDIYVATLNGVANDVIAAVPDMVDGVLFEIGTNKYNPDTKVGGYINNDTGNVTSSDDYFTSDFIDVSDFQYGYAFTPKARKILFYDANQNAIASSYYTNETAAGVITLNASYKYVRFSWYKTSTDVMVCDASTLPGYVPYEIVAKDGVNYLNTETRAKVQQMVGEGGKSAQIASYLSGKTIAVFGDSIMHGAGNNDKGIADLLAEKYGMTAADYSVSGATMGVRTDDPQYTIDEAHHIAKQVRNAISARIAPDLIIFNGGTNDIGGQIPIGTMSAVYTQPSSESYFADGFETVAYLLTKNFVGVPIVYMRAHNMSSRTYQGQIDYGELGNSIAEKWGIETADMYKQMNTQLAEYRTAYLADYTHPNEAGYNKYYIPAIENFVFNKMV